jgi:hypothetical protein
MSKDSKYLIRFNFQIEFETQFELLREELLKEDLQFLANESSPIIYCEEVNFTANLNRSRKRKILLVHLKIFSDG